MDKGRELGLLVKDWIASGSVDLRRSQALSNRLLDALGADEQLRTPLKDLAAQPLLKVVLQGEGAARSSALTALIQQLEPVYAPGVLGELVDLLEAATGLQAGGMGASFDGHERAVEAAVAPPGGDGSDLREERSDRLEDQQEEWVPPEPPPRPGSAFEQARLLGPGVALAAVASLVWRWGAAELDQWLFEPRDWNGGAVLLAVLLVVQILALGPLRYLRREWPLELMDAGDPRSAWRWITAPWIHHAHREASVNLLALLLLSLIHI